MELSGKNQSSIAAIACLFGIGELRFSLFFPCFFGLTVPDVFERFLRDISQIPFRLRCYQWVFGGIWLFSKTPRCVNPNNQGEKSFTALPVGAGRSPPLPRLHRPVRFAGSIETYSGKDHRRYLACQCSPLGLLLPCRRLEIGHRLRRNRNSQSVEQGGIYGKTAAINPGSLKSVIGLQRRSLPLVSVRIWFQMHKHIPDTEEPFHELVFDRVSDAMSLFN